MIKEEDLRKMEAEIRQLRTKLTKRNEDYVFHLNKILEEINFPLEKKVAVLGEVVPKLLEGQKQGKTAKQIFGPVLDYVKSLDQTSMIKKNEDPKLMLLDNVLMMFGMLAALNTIMMFFTKDQSQVASNGIITLIVMSVVGGVVFLLMFHMFYKYDREGADQSKKPKWWIGGGVVILGLAIWILLMFLTTLLPKAFNPVIPPEISGLLAVISLVAWRILHKKFNIESSLAPNRTQVHR